MDESITGDYCDEALAWGYLKAHNCVYFRQCIIRHGLHNGDKNSGKNTTKKQQTMLHMGGKIQE